MERFTENTIVDKAVLRDGLHEIREKGYGCTVEELEGGLNAVGAPIRSPDGAVVGAVSVSGPAFRLSTDSIPEMAELVKGAAGQISRCLGFHGTDTDGDTR
jgi:DNA-binding IclR family transcriptional regulator